MGKKFDQIIDSLKVRRQYELTSRFFGFDIKAVSNKNLKRMRQLLLDGSESITALKVSNSQSLETQFPTHLTDEETMIFNVMTSEFSLKHATDAIEPIKNSGKMLSLRERESILGVAAKNRHTFGGQGLDQSVYFVMGLGPHEVPKFVQGSSHVISVAVNEMDESVIRRFWVSGHLSEYMAEHVYTVVLGNALLKVKHRKDMTKQYDVFYEDGTHLEWKLKYKDEIFAQGDVAPGIALQFIHFLRILGGDNNPLIKKLYSASGDYDSCFQMLQILMPHIMPGWVYPEAKIISHLDINKPFVTIKPTKAQKYLPNIYIEYYALSDAIKSQSLDVIRAMLDDGYCLDIGERDSLLSDVVEAGYQENECNELLTLLITHGAPINLTWRDNPVTKAIEKKCPLSTIEILVKALSPTLEEPLIQTTTNLNAQFSRACNWEGHINLVDYCFDKKVSQEVLSLLYECDADFVTNANVHIRRCIKDDGINWHGLRFLKKLV